MFWARRRSRRAAGRCLPPGGAPLVDTKAVRDVFFFIRKCMSSASCIRERISEKGHCLPPRGAPLLDTKAVRDVFFFIRKYKSSASCAPAYE